MLPLPTLVLVTIALLAACAHALCSAARYKAHCDVTCVHPRRATRHLRRAAARARRGQAVTLATALVAIAAAFATATAP